MVDLDKYTPLKLTAVFIIIALIGLGFFYTQQGDAIPATFGGMAVLSADEVTVEGENTLLITATQSGVGQGLKLEITPEDIQEATDGEKTIENTITLELDAGKQYAEYSLHSPTPLYGYYEEEMSNWLAYYAFEACKEKYSNAEAWAVSSSLPFSHGHLCIAPVQIGELHRTYQPTHYFENTFRIMKQGEEVDSFTITANKLSEEIKYQGKTVGGITVIGGLQTFNNVNIPLPDRVKISNDGTKLFGEANIDPGSYKNSLTEWRDCLNLYGGLMGVNPDELRQCSQENLQQPQIIEHGLVLKSDADEKYLRYELSDYAVKPVYQIQLKDDLVNLIDITQPKPIPEIRDFEVQQEVIEAGETVTATYKACNIGDDEGKFRVYLTGKSVSSNDRGETQVIQPGECVEEEIDVTGICFTETDMDVTLTLHPYYPIGVEPAEKTISGLTCKAVTDCTDNYEVGSIVASGGKNAILECQAEGDWLLQKQCEPGEVAVINEDGEGVCRGEEGEIVGGGIVPSMQQKDYQLLGLMIIVMAIAVIIAGGYIYAKK